MQALLEWCVNSVSDGSSTSACYITQAHNWSQLEMFTGLLTVLILHTQLFLFVLACYVF